MKSLNKESPLRFLLVFFGLFLLFYYFNILFFSITSRGNHYLPFFDRFNYIRWFRHFLLFDSKSILNLFGYNAISNDYQLLVAGHGVIDVIYSCLGLGVMSFFAAFVMAYPKRLKPKLIFLVTGLVCMQVLNVLRFVLLALLWNKKSGMIIDHHTIFNAVIYILIGVSLYFWVNHDDKQPVNGAKN